MPYGDDRFSTPDQDPSIELDALAAGCTMVRSEKVSGTTPDSHEELATLLQFMREGETM
jgi:DNA invertase Pin-like site-specific DNA recombinase